MKRKYNPAEWTLPKDELVEEGGEYWRVPGEPEPIVPPDMVPAAVDYPSFDVKDVLTVYEAAMVYAGRHPYPLGRRDCWTLLKAGLAEKSPRKGARAKRSWDVFCTLKERIRRGQIKPIAAAHDPAGEVDFIATKIALADLVQLAKDRGERPRHLRRWLDAAGGRAAKRPLTQRAADKFAAEYIAREKHAGRHPTQQGLERAAKDAGLRGGREFLRLAAKEALGNQVKRGRPAKFAEK